MFLGAPYRVVLEPRTSLAPFLTGPRAQTQLRKWMRNVSTLTHLAALEDAEEQIRRQACDLKSPWGLLQSEAARHSTADKMVGIVAEAVDKLSPTGDNPASRGTDEVQVAAQEGALAAAGALLMAQRGLDAGDLSQWEHLHPTHSLEQASLTDGSRGISSHVPHHGPQPENRPRGQQQQTALEQPDVWRTLPLQLDVQVHVMEPHPQILPRQTHARTQEDGPRPQDTEPSSRSLCEAELPPTAIHPLRLYINVVDRPLTSPFPAQSATTESTTSDDQCQLFSSSPPGEAAPAYRRPVPALDFTLRALGVGTASISPTSSSGNSPSPRSAPLVSVHNFNRLALLLQKNQ